METYKKKQNFLTIITEIKKTILNFLGANSCNKFVSFRSW